jgi:O-antigen/teichoic acid export membrane protein
VRALISSGVTVSASLIIRSAIENLAVLAVAWSRRPPAEVGHVGLAVLIANAALVLTGAVNSLLLPLSAAASFNRGEQYRDQYYLFLRYGGTAVGLTVVLAVVLWAGSWFVATAFGQAYALAAPYLRFSAVALPARALTSACGTIFLANDRVGVTLLVNVGTLVAIATAYYFAVPTGGGLAACTINAATETIVAVVYATMAFHLFFRRARGRHQWT